MEKFLIITAITTSFALSPLSISIPALADNTPKATGSVRFGEGKTLHAVEFQAKMPKHEPVEGRLVYMDGKRAWYLAEIKYGRMPDDPLSYAFFAGPIIRSSHPSWLGKWAVLAVKDGEPDQISLGITSPVEAVFRTEKALPPGEFLDISQGDISLKINF